MKRDPGALFFRPISDHFLYADWIEDKIWGIPSFRITTGKFGTTPIWPPEVRRCAAASPETVVPVYGEFMLQYARVLFDPPSERLF